MMLLFGADGASFDPMRLMDYGAVGIMLLMVVYAYNRSEKKLQTVYEDVVTDARKSLIAERDSRQEFEGRISSILDQLVKTVGGLADQVGQKRGAIDQLSSVVTDLAGVVQQANNRNRTSRESEHK